MHAKIFTFALIAVLVLGFSKPVMASDVEEEEQKEQEPAAKHEWLIGEFDTQSKWVTGGLLIGLGAYYASADADDIRDLGDVTQFVPGVFGLTSSWGIGDRAGMRQFGLSAGTALVATHGLKQLVDKDRPDGTDDLSFPSGHTSASVMGAGYVWRRYGPKWGAPASVLAAYTGLSRVKGRKHFVDDVVSGAAIGILSNLLWTTPIDKRIRMSLFTTEGGAGLQMEVDTSPAGSRSAISEEDALPRRFFAWEMGLLNVSRNVASAPGGSGTPIDWRFDENNIPTATGIVAMGWRPTSKSPHTIYALFSPFEIRETAVLLEDVDFAGTSFLSGSEIASRFVANDYRMGYGYNVSKSDRWNLSLGGSVVVYDTQFELANDASYEKVSETVVRPVIGARLNLALTERWLAFASASHWSDSEVTISDLSVQVAYRFSLEWAMSLGFRKAVRELELDSLSNDLRLEQISLGVWYLW